MTLDHAIALAATEHAGQTDRLGEPYIRHLCRVVELLAPDTDAMTVGALHDLLEDTDYELRPEALPYKQFQALRLLTRNGDDSYEDYIVRLAKANGPEATLARKVKRADLTDNLKRNHRLRDPKRGLLHARYVAAFNALAKRDGGPPWHGSESG